MIGKLARSAQGLLQSWLVQAVQTAQSHGAVKDFQRILRKVRSSEFTMTMDERALTQAFGHVSGVREVTVSFRDPVIAIDVVDSNGAAFFLVLRFHSCAFAQGGAKEISFVIDSSNCSATLLQALMTSLFTMVAKTLWGWAHPNGTWQNTVVGYDSEGAIVRCDLQSLLPVRQFAQQRLGAAILAAFVLHKITFEKNQLLLHLRLPV